MKLLIIGALAAIATAMKVGREHEQPIGCTRTWGECNIGNYCKRAPDQLTSGTCVPCCRDATDTCSVC